MNDLVFISMENWDDIWRRNQFVCAGLARRHPEMKLLFVGLPRDISNQIRRLKFTSDEGPETWSPPGLPNITITRPVKLLPNSLAAGRLTNELLMRRCVRRAAAQMGIENPLLWLNPHYAVHMIGRMNESGVIYDITDDWTALPDQTEAEIARIRKQDQQLCSRADTVIVCSSKLQELKKSLARDLRLIPNGVDAAHYRQVLDDRSTLPEPMSRWARPVLGYTGSIHPQRVDLDLVEALARRFSSGTIALVGPDMLPPADQARMAALGNVVLTGAVPYAKIPQYMRGFDLCMTPHRMNAFTESLNPIKLWEYLAAGKPIVATDVAGFRDYPELVYLARDSAGFIAAVEQALQEGPEKPLARRREAELHSWESRIDAIENAMSAAISHHRKNPIPMTAASPVAAN